MSRYVVAPAAQRDIRAIYNFIEDQSEKNAAKVVRALYDEFDTIADMPGIGHTRPGLHDDTLRVIAVYKYLVIYDPTSKPLQILRVIHGARDLGNAFLNE